MNRKTSKERSPKKISIFSILIILVVAIVSFYFFWQRINNKNLEIAPTPEANYGMGTTPGNTSNFGLVTYTEPYTYIANFNSGGTVERIDQEGSAETVVDLNDSRAEIGNLNVYNGNLYFTSTIFSENRITLFKKDLSLDEEPGEFISFSTTEVSKLTPFLINDKLYLFISSSSDAPALLNEYDLEGVEIKSIQTNAKSITSDGTSLYGIDAQHLYAIDQDLNESLVSEFNSPSIPDFHEFFFYNNKLYYETRAENTGAITTSNPDGSDYRQLLEFEFPVSENETTDKEINQEPVSFNAEDDCLFVMYNQPESRTYRLTKYDLASAVETELFTGEDNYEQTQIDELSRFISSFVLTGNNSIITMRLFDSPAVGVFSQISYDGVNTFLGEYDLPRSNSFSMSSFN